MRRAAAFTIVLLLVISGLPGLAQRPGGGPAVDRPNAVGRSFHEDQQYLYLENGLISLKFNKTAKGGLESVMDPVKGVEFRPDRAQPPVLFQLVLWTIIGYNELVLTGLQANNFSYSGCDDCIQDGRSWIVMTFSNMTVAGIDVTARVEVRDADPRSYWGISVHNGNASLAIVEVRYPVVLGLTKDIGTNGLPDTLAMPRFDGITYADPYKWTQPPSNEKFRFQYPGELSMQFMAFYDTASAGLYLEARDPEGNVKELFMEDQGGPGKVAAGIAHMRPFEPAMNADLIYDSAMAIFHGDWYSAADLYKGWALNQPWTNKGPVSGRNDMPGWALTPSPVVVIERSNDSGDDKVPVEQWSDIVATYKALTGTNITLQVQGWEQNGTYTGPYYLPPKDGDGAVKTEVKEVLVAGGHVMFSTSEDLWRLQVPQRGYDDTAEFELKGSAYAVMNLSGGPTMDPRADALGMPAALMDPTTNYWHDTDTAISGGVAGDVVDIQELQDIAWAPCYNPAHIHYQGPSSQITAGHRAILADSLTAGRAVNPDFMLTIEGPSEIFLDLVQAYKAGDNAPDRGPYLDDMKVFGNDAGTAPMFAYVYHHYTTAYGTTVPMSGLDMPALYNSSARAIARAYVNGEVPSGQSPGASTGNSRLSTLYAREAKAMATYARDYLWLGTMLPPPAMLAIDAQVPYRLDPREGHEAAGWGVDTDQQVLSSAWLSPDGKRMAVAMVNWGNSSADVGIFVPSYGLPDQDYTLVMTRNGERSTIAASVRLPHSMSITMGPRDVVLIEALHGPDLAVEDIKADPTTVVTGGTVNISVSVANRGSVGTGNIHVVLMENGTYIDDSVIGQLGPDVNVTIGFVWPSEGKLLGTYNLTANIWPLFGELSTSNNQISTDVDVLPIPRGTIRCAVVDNTTKTSLAGARVSLFDLLMGTVLGEGTSAIGSDVPFLGLLPGTYGLNVTRSGYLPSERMDIAVVGGTTTYVTVALVPVPVVVTTGDLAGTAVDNATKAPLSGVKVVVIGVDLTYTTMPDGVFTFLDLAAGPVSLALTKADYVGTNIATYVTADRTTYLYVNLTALPPPVKIGDLVGTVQDERTKLPVANALLNLTYTGTGPDIGPMEMTTDGQGSFLFTAIVLGPYSLNVTAQGYVGVDVSVNVTTEGENLVSVNLKQLPAPPPPKVTLKGFVKDSDGSPVKGAKVQAVGTARSATYSDGTGYYQIPGIGTGTFVVNVTMEGYQDLIRTINATAGGELWLNLTLVKTKTEPTGPEATYLLVALNLLMLVGILVMLVTGRRETEDKKRKRPRRIKRVAVRKVSRMKARDPMVVASEEE